MHIFMAAETRGRANTSRFEFLDQSNVWRYMRLVSRERVIPSVNEGSPLMELEASGKGWNLKLDLVETSAHGLLASVAGL
jgi:hypothetical protein